MATKWGLVGDSAAFRNFAEWLVGPSYPNNLDQRFSPKDAPGIIYQIYFRKGPRILGDVRYDRCLDIATFGCNRPGSGYFGSLMDILEDMVIASNYQVSYIENLMGSGGNTGERLLAWTRRRGYIMIPNRYDPDNLMPCLYKPLIRPENPA